MGAAESVEFLVLTEDSGRDGAAVIFELTRTIAKLVDAYVQTHKLAPRQPPAPMKALANAANWLEKAAHHELVSFVGYIATELAMARDSGRKFVVFHLDADVVWSEIATADGPDWSRCANHQRFTSKIRDAVVGRLEFGTGNGGLERAEAERVVDEHLLLMMPVYTIESWLYQHTKRAIELCHESFDGRHVDRFEAWATDRSLLDEVPQPKTTTVLSAAYNLELAGVGYPAQAVWDAERSFHHTVEVWDANNTLKGALESTWNPP